MATSHVIRHTKPSTPWPQHSTPPKPKQPDQEQHPERTLRDATTLRPQQAQKRNLTRDEWVSTHPTTPVDLKQLNQLGKGAAQESLTRLHAAGLLRRVTTPKHLDVSGASDVPGPQFHWLTPAARARLQDERILAAGPETALADAIRLRRNHSQNYEGDR